MYLYSNLDNRKSLINLKTAADVTAVADGDEGIVTVAYPVEGDYIVNHAGRYATIDRANAVVDVIAAALAANEPVFIVPEA